MNRPVWIDNAYLALTNRLFAIWPQRKPSQDKMAACRLISHRGEYDNINRIENTLPAFDLAQEQKIWGIEFDIRWTKDLVPVVSHDPDCRRLFQSDIIINQVTAQALRAEVPQMPTLQEVIERYGKSLHLMIEFKQEDYPDASRQNQCLKDLFAQLTPGEDYHFLSLYPEMFAYFTYPPPKTFIPIVQVSAKQLSRQVFEKQWGGITGHYLLLNQQYINKHCQADQHVGTGIVTSRNCLYREINRGVEWIFCEPAIKMKQYL